MARLNRRKFLKYLGVGLAAGAATGIAGYEIYSRVISNPQNSGSSYVPPADATSDYAEFMDWLASVAKPFLGQSLNISLEYEFSPLAIQNLDPDFLGATGINNDYELKPYSLHLADVLQMVQTKSSDYDLFSVDYQDIASFADYVLSPTDLADKYPDLTYEKINPSDYFTVPWSYCASYPPQPFQSSSSGDILFLPNNMATIIQYYRSDLYQAAGISPANTWDDYVSNAKTLTGSQATYGTVNESSPDISVIFDFLGFLAGNGESLWSVKNGEITTNLGSSAATSALDTYLSLKPFSDPSSYIYTWDDIANDLLRGIGASALEFQEYSPWMNDPTRSLIVNDMGYSSMPAGPSGSFSVYGGDGIAVSVFSKKPEIAWLWLQWANSLGAQEMALLGPYQAFPSRMGVFDNSTIMEAIRSSKYSATVVTKQAWDTGSIATLLPFPKWTEALADISNYLYEAWLDRASSSNALSSAVNSINGLGSLTF